MHKCDAVFEGGGVKGLGLIGAVKRIEEAGYTFENLAGTSAGAIISALLAVGYTGSEIERELLKLDLEKFKKNFFLGWLGIPGKLLNVCFKLGVFSADYFESWLQVLLERKGKTTFGQIRMPEYSDPKYMYKFQAIASDSTQQQLLILPGALSAFGHDPDSFSIARAVRMSMSIPIFFAPCSLIDAKGKKHLIVDGGMLSNYPVWLLDDGTKSPPWPTFGFKFSRPDPAGGQARKNSILNYIISLVTTMMDAHDQYFISVSKGDFDRSILISSQISPDGAPLSVSTTDFNISNQAMRCLIDNGYSAADRFLKTWDFSIWKAKFRV